jgi:hypothetical protein
MRPAELLLELGKKLRYLFVLKMEHLEDRTDSLDQYKKYVISPIAANPDPDADFCQVKLKLYRYLVNFFLNFVLNKCKKFSRQPRNRPNL